MDVDVDVDVDVNVNVDVNIDVDVDVDVCVLTCMVRMARRKRPPDVYNRYNIDSTHICSNIDSTIYSNIDYIGGSLVRYI